MKVCRLGSWIWVVLLGLSLSGAHAAAPPLTTIDDMLYKADGSPFEGVLLINWKSFEGPGQTNIPTNSVRAEVREGRLFVKLVPTTTAPAAAYYSVRYVAAGSVQSTELWSVAPSDTALLVRDVRIDWPPSTTALVAPATDITIADVEGLTSALDVRPVKGQGYSPSRAAVIGPTGDVEAAPGLLSDCVRVDGTSGPCGSGGTVAGFVDAEAPGGTLDGINAGFTLSAAPDPASSLLLHRNGLLQNQGLDYTVSGAVITFDGAAIPLAGDLLLASYRINSELTSSYGFVDAETPQGDADGVNDAFTLAGIPDPASSLLLYRNGLLQRQGLDYTVSGAAITFAGASVPQDGDTLQASYRTAGN